MDEAELKIADRLALDRTRMAAERTLMAWLRTALSMITFGFAIYKFLQVLQDESTAPLLNPHAPRNVGLTLTGIGSFALFIACVQYRQHIRALGPDERHKAWDLTFIVACTIWLLGILIFGSILLHSGPFG